MKFYQDLSSKTLERRAEQIPRLIQERKKGNIAYFVLDKLIIHQRKTGLSIMKMMAPSSHSIAYVSSLKSKFCCVERSFQLFSNYFLSQE